MPFSGGARKVPWAGPGRGTRGGVRVITFYGGPPAPVFLLTVFGKGERANLTGAERNALRKILGELATEYRKGTRRHVRIR